MVMSTEEENAIHDNVGESESDANEKARVDAERKVVFIMTDAVDEQE